MVNLGYLLPRAKRASKPIMDAMGRHHKRQYLKRKARG
jgi:hypothetical protein